MTSLAPTAYDWFNAHDTERRFATEAAAEGDLRDPYERDRARIVHSAAFRRLQGKSQIFAAGWSGYLRTRVTHAMEVAQIARALASNHGLPGSLAEAAALAHDLGHPPFGHNGEDALAACMAPYGGFEGNAQTVRILTRLEPLTTRHPGVNVTRATLLGVLKYPGGHHGLPALYEDDADDYTHWLYAGVSEAQRHTPSRSVICQIMDWADDIAYSLHDLEDSLTSQLLSAHSLRSREVVERVARRARRSDPALSDDLVLHVLHSLWSRLDDGWSAAPSTARVREVGASYVHRFVTGTRVAPLTEGGHVAQSSFDFALLVPDEDRQECTILKAITQELVLRDQRTGVQARQAVRIVRDLFELLLETALGDLEDIRAAVLPPAMRSALQDTVSERARARMVCDFIADMTDAQAGQYHERLFSARQSSPFAPL
ncbi:deoxyguanosinetriphosphate triphosphohydrolase family protein [Deinococcus peraridilitoris]|uniref:Deoxyguanosinetriphosphate triphosphohydrolase-like protein n=1 Tax=Deinococcus peraridilitoris (strain DSM 19664 / LMG 22246 / CIP 109416 / KR-200) TaxID=937777 RepID=L0A7K3_DEIPD|nr:dNTP triphosphohydrolase [Deinococcus peraridilitoris]AFZ69142.1 deoxyguanosinetriphosphate triphosphohydrolase, putative [Deinococcus peraridilitoris DSM 19664]